MQHADERQVAVTLGKIKPIADDKEIRNLKADVIGANFFDSTRRLVQQNANFCPARIECANFWQHAAQGFSRVQNIIHEQHVAAANIEAQFLRENQIAGFRAEAVAGNANEIKAQRQVQVSDQIGEKHHRAAQERDDDHFTSPKIALNFACEDFDATRDLLFGN